MVRAYLCVLVFLSLCVGASPLKSIVPFYQTEMGFGIDAQSVKVRTMWHLFGHICDQDMVIPQNIKGNISVKISPKSCDDLKAQLLTLGPWEEQQHLGRMVISPAKDHYQGFPLKYINSQDAMKAITKVIPKKYIVPIGEQKLLVHANVDTIKQADDLIKLIDQPQNSVKLMMLAVWLNQDALRELGLDWEHFDMAVMKQSWPELWGLIKRCESSGNAHVFSHDEVIVHQGHTGVVHHQVEHSMVEKSSWGFSHSALAPDALMWEVTPLTQHLDALNIQQKIDWSWFLQGDKQPEKTSLTLDHMTTLNQDKPTLLAHHQWDLQHHHRYCSWLPWCLDKDRNNRQFMLVFASWSTLT